MNRFWVRPVAVLACAAGAWLMASSLFGYHWWDGEQHALEIRGGVINVLLCSKADDPEPLPMGVGDHDGCTSQAYAQNEVAPGGWFGGPMHMTLALGAGAAGLFFLFATALALGLEFAVVPWRQPLSFTFFDIEAGEVVVHQHPGRQAGYLAVVALVALGIASASAPANLFAGPDLMHFVAGALLALAAGFVADPRVLASERVARRLWTGGADVAAGESVADASSPMASEPLPEAEVADDDSPTCVRCGKATAWLEKVGRHRCLGCGMYQPLHAPGALADVP